MGVRSGLERRCSARRIAGIALTYLVQKPRKVNIEPLSLQLFIPTVGPHLRARRQEHLYYSVRKDGGSHIPAIRYQAGRPAQGVLFVQQRLPDGRYSGNTRSGVPGFLRTQYITDVLPAKQDRDGAVRPRLEFDIELFADCGEPAIIAKVDPGTARGEADQPVKGSAVQEMPAKASRQLQPNRSFAGTARPVNGDNRYFR